MDSSRDRKSGRIVALALMGACLAAVAQAGEQGDALVRAELEAFVRERVESAEPQIEVPPLSRFAVDGDRFEEPLRVELSTRERPPFAGRVAITVELYAGAHLLKRGVVSPYVRIEEDVYIPTRDLHRGDILSAGDLQRVTRDRNRLPQDPVRDRSDAVGQRVARSVRQDRVLRMSHLESVPMVERGDRVTLFLDTGSIQIRSVGMAAESGAVGDWIRVKNLDSRRELSGRIDREGRVHVAF